MAYIAPSTVITFYRNTGLSDTYDNTLYFSTEQEKHDYFTRWSSQLSVVNNTYQRENRNYVRVNIPISQIYNVDYMRFNNVSFENHVFYAFVTAVNYVNNTTTEVEYKIDPIMTWMGVFELRQCWVEREHSATDNIGDNIIGEKTSINGYVEEGTETSPDYGASNSTIRLQVADPDEAQANNWGGIYNPTKFYDGDAAATANTIGDLVQQDLVSNIVNLYMVPNAFINVTSPTANVIKISKPYGSIDGYVPKNKKLFTYPYKYMITDNSEGNSKIFYYEFFNGTPAIGDTDACTFATFGTSVNSVEVDLVPFDYNGHNNYDFSNKLVMSHFPVCAWSYDTYEAYLAQKNAYLLHDTAKDLTGFINGMVTFNYAGIANSVGSAIGNIENALIDNYIKPEAGSTVVGSGNSDITFQTGEKHFNFHKMSINKQQAKLIDDYFTMFGYAQKQIMVPNMNVRPHWTYVKTLGCVVEGNLPASDKSAIESIFDHGIRFWHSLEEMGNYSLDNSPA